MTTRVAFECSSCGHLWTDAAEDQPVPAVPVPCPECGGLKVKASRYVEDTING